MPSATLHVLDLAQAQLDLQGQAAHRAHQVAGLGEGRSPFRVIKCQFGYVKIRFLGLAKHKAQQTTLFALSNLWMARKHVMGMGELRV